MNIEEKAKAYDEALERAKKLQKTCDSQAVVGWCEYILPELAESEDENIRGAIIDHLKDNNLTEWAAWLEKQGEQKPAWSEEDEKRAERLLGWLDTLINYIHHDAIVSLDLRRERMQQVKQLKSWLKSLKDRYT